MFWKLFAKDSAVLFSKGYMVSTLLAVRTRFQIPLISFHSWPEKFGWYFANVLKIGFTSQINQCFRHEVVEIIRENHTSVLKTVCVLDEKFFYQFWRLDHEEWSSEFAVSNVPGQKWITFLLFSNLYIHRFEDVECNSNIFVPFQSIHSPKYIFTFSGI